ncbi:MAG TPA: class I SAM-dependent methyltransferase [Polyangia bacterium]|nr:class I SAM-dependent methyltransferase [Polyangia bacterium]
MRHEAPRPGGMERVAACYRDAGRVYAAYIAAKLRIDPIHRAALELVPPSGEVIDLGCGSGQLALLLAWSQPARVVTGLDQDWARIARARRAAEHANGAVSLRYLVSDVRTAPLQRCRAVLIVDVLHSLPPPDQDAVMRRAAHALEPGGVLLVRDVDRGVRPWWRFALVALEEALATALGWAQGSAGLWFRRADELAAVLAGEGLRVETRPMWGQTPYANVLLIGRR